MVWNLRNIIVWLLDIVLAVISFFIGFRILLRFFNANAQTPFVNCIYRVSDNLVYSFNGIFPNLSSGVSGVFDIVAIIALVAYIIVFYIAIIIVDSIFNATANRWHRHHTV